MTDKQQSDALRLADELEDSLESHDGSSLTARCQGIADAAAAELLRLHAENETLRTGYEAARLEIESLKAQLHAAKQINTAQFWLLTSSIPGSALRASHWQAPAQAAAPAQAGEYPALVCDYCGALTPDPWHSSGMLHGKMSKHIHSCDACCRGAAQAAPAYKDSTPELHIGDSAFESWYSTYSPAHKSDKQRARDAYAAGMGDPLVTAAPAAVAGPSLYQVMAVAKAIHATTPDADDWDSLRQCEVDALRGRAEKVLAALAAAPTANPAPQQDVSAAGGDSFLLLPTRPTPDAPANTAGLSWDAYSGAQMLAYGRSCSDAALVVAAHQPSPAAQGDALDAARWHWLSEHIQVAWNEGKFTSLVRIVSEQHRQSLNASVDRMMAGDWSDADAARAAQEGNKP